MLRIVRITELTEAFPQSRLSQTECRVANFFPFRLDAGQGKRRKEFAESEGPRGPSERARASPLQDEGEPTHHLRRVSLRNALLIPAFSPKEKENRSPSHGNLRDWICQESLPVGKRC